MEYNLNIFYQNVRGLRTKTNTFFRAMMLGEYDIVCLSETWLYDGIFDSELFDSRYTVHRCDRNYNERGDTWSGGGVLVALKSNLTVRSSTSIQLGNFSAEIVKVTISLASTEITKSLHIYCCYFPNINRHCDTLIDFFELVSDEKLNYPNDSFLVLGDFNIPTAQWVTTYE